jgi:hypothetical protein
MVSLRTQLAVKAARAACDAIAALAGSLDTLSLDQLLATAWKLCAQAKRIVQVAGAEVVETAIAVLPTSRPMATIQAALGDRNKELRVIGAHMLLVLLQHCPLSRPVADGLRDVLVRGLADAAPAVRETTRLAYWAWRVNVLPATADTCAHPPMYHC